MVPAVADPYKALGLPHDASQSQIKAAYRRLALKYHPDRFVANNSSERDRKEAADKFASISAAYGLLSDLQRKRQYDHIYKYGGFDEDEEKIEGARAQSATSRFSAAGCQRSSTSPPHATAVPNIGSSGRGIGFATPDPISFILCRPRGSRYAGVHIPSRADLARAAAGQPGTKGVGLSFSSGRITTTKDGTRLHVSKTTSVVNGKKITKIETATIHPDGKKEVVAQGNIHVHRNASGGHPSETCASQVRAAGGAHPDSSHGRPRKSNENSMSPEKEMPWYSSVWNGVCQKFAMCYNPCREGGSSGRSGGGSCDPILAQ